MKKISQQMRTVFALLALPFALTLLVSCASDSDNAAKFARKIKAAQAPEIEQMKSRK